MRRVRQFTSKRLAVVLESLSEGRDFRFGPVFIERYQGRWQVQAGAGMTICKSALRAAKTAIWLANKNASPRVMENAPAAASVAGSAPTAEEIAGNVTGRQEIADLLGVPLSQVHKLEWKP